MNQEIHWLKISRTEISEKMKAAGICVSRNIISKLLKKHGFVKRKLQLKRACGQHADRNQQFEIITNKKATFEENQQPVISIDTKKELLGPHQFSFTRSQESLIVARA